MRQSASEIWAGVAMLIVSVAVAAPALFGVVDPAIPRGAWIAIFAVFLASLLAAPVPTLPPVLRYTAYGIATMGAWGLIITAPMGLLLILLVVTATVSVYVVPIAVSFVVITLNTAVVAYVTADGRGDGETLMMSGFYLLIQVASFFSSATLVREQRLRRELAAANVELQGAAALLAQSERAGERLRISRDLHDAIGHQLTVLTLELETARHLEAGAARAHIERANGVARELLNDVRATVGRLRSEAPDLAAALRKIAGAAPGLSVSVSVDSQLNLTEEHNSVLLRAIQEIVTNTLRHAHARELWVEVRGEGDDVVLATRDDGRGASRLVMGNGLRGLTERFGELGGELRVDGDRGFQLTARIPAS